MTPFEQLAAREFFGIKLGLDNVRALTAALGHPERACPSVIIAGTNGKGSVAAMVSRALHAAGHRVGLYTSPHLIDLTERYRVAEQPVTPQTLAAALTRVLAVEAGLRATGGLQAPATYFELATVAAFEVFRAASVDVMVLEVGLGGRFDATNVADAGVAAITSIAFDHMAHLGDSLAAIAFQKAGVIARGAHVVSGVREPEAAAVIAEVARDAQATLVEAHEAVRASISLRGHETWATLHATRATYGPLRLALNGRHQGDNAAVAVCLLETLDATGVAVSTAAIETGLREAHWPARLQVIERPGRPLLIIDGAHNPAGARALADWLRESEVGPVTLVLATMRDKDSHAMLEPLLDAAACVVTTSVLPPRGLEAEALADAVRHDRPSLSVHTAPAPQGALHMADQYARPIVVAGSLFLAGALLARLAEGTEPP